MSGNTFNGPGHSFFACISLTATPKYVRTPPNINSRARKKPNQRSEVSIMSRITLSRLSLILIVLTLLGIFPFSASAANNEYVLTSINHVAALNAVDVKNTTSAALTVPHDYPARTVNLANGLDIQYDTTIYSSLRRISVNSISSGRRRPGQDDRHLPEEGRRRPII